MSYPPGTSSREIEQETGSREDLSDCCGAEIIHTDLCSECKEHCEPFDNEEDCDVAPMPRGWDER